MNAEIEAKFLDVDHDEVRSALEVIGAKCQQADAADAANDI